MSYTTGIAWTESTWSPVRGCTRVSEGCRHCYAERFAARGLPAFHRRADGSPFAIMKNGKPAGWLPENIVEKQAIPRCGHS